MQAELGPYATGLIPRGSQGLGDVLDGVGVAELVGPHRADQDDGFLDIGLVGLQVIADVGERIGNPARSA